MKKPREYLNLRFQMVARATHSASVLGLRARPYCDTLIRVFKRGKSGHIPRICRVFFFERHHWTWFLRPSEHQNMIYSVTRKFACVLLSSSLRPLYYKWPWLLESFPQEVFMSSPLMTEMGPHRLDCTGKKLKSILVLLHIRCIACCMFSANYRKFLAYGAGSNPCQSHSLHLYNWKHPCSPAFSQDRFFQQFH